MITVKKMSEMQCYRACIELEVVATHEVSCYRAMLQSMHLACSDANAMLQSTHVAVLLFQQQSSSPR